MNKMKFIYTSILGTMLFYSCSNDLPVFDDKDAFVAFTETSMSVDENVESGELKIPVLLTSLSGLDRTIQYEVVEGKAKPGVHYEVVDESQTLHFTKDEPTQYIVIRIIDNDSFGGDVDFTVNLKPSTEINLGDSQSCTVKIVDNEHPLADILGTYNAAGQSYWGSALSWSVTLEKDDEDVTKVWISNMVPGGSSLKVYGTVNDDKTEIKIPVAQEIAESSSYPLIVLEGIDADFNDIPKGGFITGNISNGTITFADGYMSTVYGDEAGTEQMGQYEIVLPNSVWSKK